MGESSAVKWIIGSIFAICFLSAALFPILFGGGQSIRAKDMSRMKQVSTSLALYSQDNNDLLPEGIAFAFWPETIGPYLPDKATMEVGHPALDGNPNDFVLNEKLMGESMNIESGWRPLLAVRAPNCDASLFSPNHAICVWTAAPKGLLFYSREDTSVLRVESGQELKDQLALTLAE